MKSYGLCITTVILLTASNLKYNSCLEMYCRSLNLLEKQTLAVAIKELNLFISEVL